MTGFIYKITNDVNDKIYIGKTLKTIEERFQEHLKDSRKESLEKRPLYNAIRAYGEEHFQVSLVEECDIDKLSDREIFWINYYSSFAKGYNATLGGDGKILYNYEEIASFLKTGASNQEVCDKFGCCKDTVSFIRKLYSISPQKKHPQMKKINQYDLSGNFIQEFNSVGDAVRWLSETAGIKYDGGVKSHIMDVCKGKRKTAYKYKWSLV